MIGAHRSGLITCVLIATIAMLELSLGICVMREVDHVALGRLYVALGLITLLGLAEFFEEYHHR